MKKIMTVLIVLLTVNSSFALTLDSDEQNSVSINATVAETGYVDNLFAAHSGLDGSENSPLLAGTKVVNYVEKNHVAIVTFDTAQIPDWAQVTGALLLISGKDQNGNSAQEYIEQHVAVDFAGQFGFGGSFFITGFDYLASAAGSVTSASGIPFPVDGILLHSDNQGNYRDLNSWINKQGKTQLRIRLESNPEDKLLSLRGSGQDENGQHIALIVIWE